MKGVDCQTAQLKKRMFDLDRISRGHQDNAPTDKLLQHEPHRDNYRL